MYAKSIGCATILSFAVYAVNAAEVDSSAGNVDLKFYSAAGCGALTNNAQVKIQTSGAIVNTNANAGNVITCPVINDRFTTGNSRAYYLTVNRPTGAAAMSCFLTSFAGTSLLTTTKSVTTTGADSNVSFSSTDNAYHSLGCNLPKKVAAGPATIKYYLVFED